MYNILKANLNINFSQPVCEGYVLMLKILFPIDAMNFLGSKNSLTDIPDTTATRKTASTIIHNSTIARISCEKVNQYYVTWILTVLLWYISYIKCKRKCSKCYQCRSVQSIQSSKAVSGMRTPTLYWGHQHSTEDINTVLRTPTQ